MSAFASDSKGERRMSDYRELVKKEAKAFADANRSAFEADDGESGGKSAAPSFPKWIDRTGKLSARIGEISEKWGLKEIHWVEVNTRSKNPQGGDPRGNAFGSLLMDVMHEIKKLTKK